jgi:hypothetical protein
MAQIQNRQLRDKQSHPHIHHFQLELVEKQLEKAINQGLEGKDDGNYQGDRIS